MSVIGESLCTGASGLPRAYSIAEDGSPTRKSTLSEPCITTFFWCKLTSEHIIQTLPYRRRDGKLQEEQRRADPKLHRVPVCGCRVDGNFGSSLSPIGRERRAHKLNDPSF
jgi:hypothetical protein